MNKAFLAIGILSLLPLGAAALLFLDAYWIEPNWVEERAVPIVSPRLAGVLEGCRFVQLTDLHMTSVGFRERAVARLLRRIRPDGIFFTGDYVSRGREDMDAVWAFFETVRKPFVRIGNYAVMGDTDDIYVADIVEEPESWRLAGVVLLDVKRIRLSLDPDGRRWVWLLGIHDDEGFSRVIRGVPRGEPTILLAHSPEAVKPAALWGVDLVLAGDTHGGQVGVPALRRFSGYASRGRYVSGLYRVRDTLLYVSRGVGFKGRPIRFLCRPEVTVFTFHARGEMRGLQELEDDRVE